MPSIGFVITIIWLFLNCSIWELRDYKSKEYEWEFRNELFGDEYVQYIGLSMVTRLRFWSWVGWERTSVWMKLIWRFLSKIKAKNLDRISFMQFLDAQLWWKISSFFYIYLGFVTNRGLYFITFIYYHGIEWRSQHKGHCWETVPLK